MIERGWQAGILITLVTLGAAVGAAAAPTVTGALGVDVDDYAFRKTVLASGGESDVSRTLSNPYLNLQVAGPLISENFADFTLGGRVSGAYFRSSDTGVESTGSVKPSLSGYDGRLSFFKGRSYPLALYLSKAELYSLRYEISNRAESELDSPALAVIRRYDSVLEQRGALWKFALPRNSSLSVEAQRSENRLNRRYDFDEDRDIFVNFATTRPDPVAAVHPVVVQNEIPDDSVLLFIDQVLVDSLAAGETVILSLEAGLHETEFVPLRLNSFRSTVNVNGDMQWQIVFNPPPGSNDISQVLDSARGVYQYDDDGPFRNETFFEYNDTREDVQQLDSQLSSLNNIASYEVSPATQLDFLTTYTQTDTEIVDVSSQSNKAFQHQSTGRWQKTRGPSVQLAHSYGRTSTRTNVTGVVSNTNTLLANGMYPTGWHDHEAGLRLNATYLNDDLGYRSRQYRAGLDNRLEVRAGGVRWEPRQMVNYTTSRTEQPDGSTNELEVQNFLTGNLLRLRSIGDVKVKGEFSWRRRETDVAATTKKKYVGELGIISKVAPGLKVGVTTTHEKEIFGEPETNVGTRTVMEDQIQHSYRVDLQGELNSSASLAANALFVDSNDTNIRRFTGSLSVRVPKIGIPIRTSLMDEKRSLTGLSDQTLFQIQTRASFNIRRIRMVLNHNFVKDRQLTEKYRYQKLLVKLTRDFDVL